MSDILASIRKIMATEPSATAPANGKAPVNGAPAQMRPDVLDKPRQAASELKPVEKSPAAAVPAPRSDAADSGPAPSPTTEAVSLDEFLAMAAPQKTPASPAAPAATVPKPKADLQSDPVTVPVAVAPPISAPKPAPASAPSPSVAAPSSAEPAIPSWLFPQPKEPVDCPAAPVAKSSDVNGSGPPPNGATPPAARVVTPAPLGAPSGLGDLGSVVPGRFDPPARGQDGQPPSQPDRTHASTAPALGPPLGPAFAGAPLGEPSRAAPDLTAEIPGADALRRLIAGVVPPSAHQGLAPAPKPADDIPTEATAPPAKAPESAVVAKAAEPPASVQPAAVVPAIAKSATPALSSEMTTLVAKPSAPAPSAAPAKPAPATTTGAVVSPLPAVSTPAPKSDVAAVSKVAEPTLPTPAVRTMDETVVELLRPLLRDWLDKNMPRLIEPALKAELDALRAELDKAPKT